MFLSDLPSDVQAWVETAPPVSANAVSVMEKRYFNKLDDQTILEDVDGMYWRTAEVMAAAEAAFGGADKVAELHRAFFELMRGRQFLPNSPTLANAGIRTGQFSACYVLPVEDDLSGIFDTIKHAALIHQTGGGCISRHARVWSTLLGLSTIERLVQATAAMRQGVSEQNGVSYDVSDLAVSVLSLDPKTGRTALQPLTKVWTFDVSPDDQYVVTTAEGTRVQTSGWHPFMTVRGTKLAEVRADELQLGDVVLGPDSPEAYWPTLENQTVLDVEITPDVAWLCGFTLGNGSFGQNAALQQERARFFSGHADTLKKVQQVLSTLGADVSIQRDARSENSYLVTTANQRVVKFLKALTGLDRGAKEGAIAIPSVITRSPLPVIYAFLAGLMDSDGAVDADGSPSYSTVSDAMHRDLAALMGLLGFKPTARTRKPSARGKQPCHEVMLCPLYQVDSLADKIGPHMASAFRRDRLHSTSTKRTMLSLDLAAWRKELAELALVRPRGSRAPVTADLSQEMSAWSAHKRVSRQDLARIGEVVSEVNPELGELLNRIALNGQSVQAVARAAQPEAYYDLTVENWNTYAAGEYGMVMVHNTGFAFTRLRPKNDIVGSTKGASSGPVPFMKVFNAATEAIKQGGIRRGANMGILRVDSPDILEFIDLKSDLSQLTNFNVSVAVTDAFLTALEAGDDRYELINPRSGPTGEFLSAREVWRRIAERAHATGEPGLAFIDRMNRDNPVPRLGAYEASNPCGEQPLIPYESCNLGSITLDQFVIGSGPDAVIDWSGLRAAVHLSIRFMDNVVEANAYVPKVPQIKEIAMTTRKLGLGIMGLARALFKLRLAYDSREGRNTAAALYAFIDAEAKRASIDLAAERGAYPYFVNNWDESVAFHQDLLTRRIEKAQAASDSAVTALEPIWHHIMDTYVECQTRVTETGIRNSTTTTIAPTGTLSVFHDTTGGCEPLFGLVFSRFQAGLEMRDGDPEFVAALSAFNEAERDEILEIVARHQGSVDAAAAAGALDYWLGKEELTELCEVFVTAGDIRPDAHVKMQAILQGFNDSATSKTINLPATATVADVLDAYDMALSLGCKGITVYRDGSRSFQPLTTGTKSSKELAEAAQLEATVPTATRGGTPRPRPETLAGFTSVIHTGNGKMLTTFNYDEFGLREVLLTIGRSGGTIHSLAEAIGRLASMALQHGAPVDDVARTLIGIRSADQAGLGPNKVLSIPDGLGKALKAAPAFFQGAGSEALDALQTELSFSNLSLSTEQVYVDEAVTIFGESPECPDCGSALKFEEGCCKCSDLSCGFSKCG